MLLDWILYGFGTSYVENIDHIDREISDYWYTTFNLGLLLKYPYDYFGYFAEMGKGNGKYSNPNAFFRTPAHVARMIVEITMTEADKTKGVLIGHDINNDPVKIDFRNLFRHITIEGSTMQGKSHFCKLFVERAVREGGMKAIVVDVSRGWTRIVERLNGKIFDTKLDMHEALKYNFSLCMVREDALDSNERDFLKPIYDYLTQERSKVRRKEKDILLVIDEAHNFSKRAKAGVLVSIAKEIGKFGVILVLISQRDQGINVEARSQATFHINTPISKAYHKSYADLYGKDIADIMLGLPERHLWLYGNQINVPFDMKPLDYEEGEWLTDEEIEKYRYIGFDKMPEPEKQQPAPQVLTNTNEVKISTSEQKPKEPEKPKDELNEDERKIVEFLKAYGKDCTSANKLFRKVLNLHSGESPKKISDSLVAKGYITIEKPHPKKSIIRLTEKGKSEKIA